VRGEASKRPWGATELPGPKVSKLVMVIPPFLNPDKKYINPYYWVDDHPGDHPLLYGKTKRLDPGAYKTPPEN